MTERLYYDDPALIQFEGKIIESGKYEDKIYTVLNRSAFYPTSGGQSNDIGLLNDIEVIDVVEDGIIVKHITETEVGKINSIVTGIIDKNRRNFKRQQHTSQHIISQCMHRLYGFITMSVHLGDEYGSVELDTGNIDFAQLHEAESMANQAIDNQLPVEILYYDKSELVKLPMRKIPAREGKNRIIKIGDFDYSACGGTHCNNSSEIKIIKFTGHEKIRNRISVKFICGNQAINDYRRRYDVTTRLSEKFTCHFDDLPDSIEKLREENKQFKKKISESYKIILPIKAEELSSEAELIGEFKFILADNVDIDSKQLTYLATLTSENISGVVVLMNDEKIIISSNTEKVNAGEAAKFIMANTSLKGGGNPKLAQLGNLDKNQIIQYKSLIRKMLSDV
jgi:alanyl-tRNA synthetase